MCLPGPSGLLQCNIGYMRCSENLVKALLLRCIINFLGWYKIGLCAEATANYQFVNSS